MAVQMADDEALARQLQAEEQRMAAGHPVQAGVVTQGMAAGQPVQAGVVTQGARPPMPVVQAVSVGGGPGPQAYGRPVAGQVVGPQYGQAYGVGPQYGQAYGVGPQYGHAVGPQYGQQYGQPNMYGQYGQYGDGPQVIVVQDPQTGAAVAVVSGPSLPDEEIVVLNYRLSMKCFSCIDAVFTILNAVSLIFDLNKKDEEEDENSKSVLGFKGIPAKYSLYLGIAGFVFLIGPVCGFMGANKLHLPMVSVYLMFCVVKTLFEIVAAVLTPHFWLLIIAIVQVYITHLVAKFWKALGEVPKDRRKELTEPGVIEGHQARMVYW